MSNNALYNIVKNILIKNGSLIPGINLIRKVTEIGENYTFELPLPEQREIGHYTLFEHHLSINENPLTRKDLKSQYHYTAWFHDKDDKKYRLHVFFNSVDNIVEKPRFSISEKESFTRIECTEHQDAFELIAGHYTQELITYLRGVQNTTLAGLEQQVDRMIREAELLSEDLLANKSAYLMAVEKTISLLQEIEMYSNFKSQVIKQIIYYKRLINAAGLIKNKPVVTNAIEDDVEEIRIPAAAKRPQAFFIPATNHPISYCEIISQLLEQFAGLEVKGINDEHLLVKCRKLLSDLTENELVFDNCGESNTDSIEYIKNLHKLRVQTEEVAKDLLKRLVIKEQFEQASQLSSLYYTLPKNMGECAVKLNKHHLLDFLIKNEIIPHSYQFKVKDVSYNSLLEYYFSQANITPAMLQCVDTLIKCGVSLMAIDKKSSLPFAAILLLNAAHPLRRVLDHNPQSTVANRMFYIQLNHLLRALILPRDFPKETITRLIEGNNAAINLLNKKSSGGVGVTLLSAQSQMRTALSIHRQLIDQLLDDPDISELRIQCETVLAKVLNRADSKTKALIKRKVSTSFEVMLKNMAKIPQDITPTFIQLKEMAVDRIKDSIALLNIRSDVLDIQLEFNALGAGKRAGRQRKQLLQKAALLEKEAVIYEQKLNDPNSLFKDLEASDAKLDELNKRLAKMKEMHQKMQELQQSLQSFTDILSHFSTGEDANVTVDTDEIEAPQCGMQ